MRILAREGFIDIKHGVGAFVADEQRLIWSRLDSIRSFTDLIRSVGGKPGDRRLTVQRTAAPEDVAEAIEIAPQTPVCLIKRVRLIDGRAARRRKRIYTPRWTDRGFRPPQGFCRRLSLSNFWENAAV